jgi:hypothetical protein
MQYLKSYMNKEIDDGTKIRRKVKVDNLEFDITAK